MIIMKKLSFSAFLLLVFLLSGCSYLENLNYDREIEHVVIDNGDTICEYVKGVRINCYKKNESEENYETQKI